MQASKRCFVEIFEITGQFKYIVQAGTQGMAVSEGATFVAGGEAVANHVPDH